MNTLPPPPAHPPGKWPGYWQVKRLRRALRRWISTRGARNRQAPPPTPLDPAGIHRILVCRFNKRLGNMVLLLPLVRSLGESLPLAEIDVIVSDPGHADLFRRLPGVRRVFCTPAWSWLALPRWLALVFRLRHRRYDLAVEPSINSLTNRLIASLAGARQLLGFFAPHQWLSLSHAVPGRLARHVSHDGLKPLELLRQTLPPADQRIVEFPDLNLNAAELRIAEQALATLAGTGPLLGFFCEATGHKRLPPEWWRDWLQELRGLRPELRLLQILPPGSTSPLLADVPALSRPGHRALAAILSRLALFVSCDAGPMHLAAAAGVPTVGLFHASDPAKYAPLGAHNLALQMKGMSPGEVARAVLQHLDSLPAGRDGRP